MNSCAVGIGPNHRAATVGQRIINQPYLQFYLYLQIFAEFHGKIKKKNKRFSMKSHDVTYAPLLGVKTARSKHMSCLQVTTIQFLYTVFFFFFLYL